MGEPYFHMVHSQLTQLRSMIITPGILKKWPIFKNYLPISGGNTKCRDYMEQLDLSHMVEGIVNDIITLGKYLTYI